MSLDKFKKAWNSDLAVGINVYSLDDIEKIKLVLNLPMSLWSYIKEYQFPTQLFKPDSWAGSQIVTYGQSAGYEMYDAKTLFSDTKLNTLSEQEETRLIQFSNWCREFYPNEEVGEDNLTEWIRKVYNKTIPVKIEASKRTGRIPLIGHGLKEGDKIRFNFSYCKDSKYDNALQYNSDIQHGNVYTIKNFVDSINIRELLGTQRGAISILEPAETVWRPLDVFDYVE